MGLFTKGQAVIAEDIYLKSVKPFLKGRDGFTHIIMINSFSKLCNQSFECEDKYTTQIDLILSNMQKEGYEIIDVKFNSLQNQGFAIKDMDGFHTLIMYK